MKNICFLIGDINHSGGTERVTTLIANNLAQQNNNVFILSLSHGDKPFFELNSSIKTQALFNEKVSMRKNFFQVIKKIRTFLISKEIQTLIVVDSISCVFTVPACVGLKINHICWEHFNLRVNLNSRFRDLGRWMAAKWCNTIVTLTERDKSFWDGRFNLSNKVVAIPNPSPYEFQKNTPSLDYKIILCVGRLTYQKGFDLLIDSWSKVAHKLPGWKIIIVGTGEDEVKLKKMTKDYQVSETIIFAGQQKNMDQFYRKASLFCMSSRFEGLPMVLLEAQSYGLPIVSFDCNTGPAEIVNESNGFLVPPEDKEKFGNALVEICSQGDTQYKKMVTYTHEKSKEFNIAHIAKKWSLII
ncbi:group 1 glycosyl transferase [Acinetobacter baumannii]|uniref:glycosyltransferase family 4 protein n=1 Tax=Acinetobacter baumannii TaxID=470 RepID=UPI000DE75E96|nr:glycosyltransferase family 4 protein [Acinetobacter baumannii]MCJ9026376.1 glycosyltransferase family 4 protein [Acinetobacter baumannii]MCJ9063656.1 glycosyltransferase family 4 protein [Acinetobacter baumannii]MCJ9096059.1 glycosyltransferase family 4 protein [Acinetobacter baumannii]MCJ9110630.1 glycosyltransferase family 4 protein [Acinetobacter baumannii]MCJ9129079.1 glycosyltransferase family 4 protein [Acinetobacter baumannii]